MICVPLLLLTNPAAQSTTVPFHFLQPAHPLIMFQARINGQGPIDCVLDTGNAAGPVLLSEKAAVQLGLKTEPAGAKPDAFGVGKDGLPSFSKCVLEEISIGDLSRRKVNAFVTKALDNLAVSSKAPFDGNVGYPFLKEFALTLDYKASMLTLTAKPAKRAGVPFEIGKKPLIVIKVVLEGKPYKFLLDTGAGATVISEESAEELHIQLGQQIQAVGAAGAEPVHLARVRNLAVGSAIQKDLDVVVAGFLEPLSKLVGTEVDGVLGYNFLNKYRVTIDYPNRTLILDAP